MAQTPREPDETVHQSADGDEDAEAQIRVAGRRVARYLLLGNLVQDEKAAVEVARLTAGLDPDDCDRTSLDYRYGAQAALSVVLSAFHDYRHYVEEEREQERKRSQERIQALEDEVHELRTRTPVDASARARPSGLGQ